MKPTQTKSKIGTPALTLSLLAGIVGASSLTAQAQYVPDRAYQFQRDRDRDRDQDRDRDRDRDYERNRRGRRWDRYGTYGGSFQLRQTALNAGYNEGIKQGRNDRNRRNGSDYRNRSAYQKATKDYSPRLGDRELYRRYYREGYENGFNDGQNGY